MKNGKLTDDQVGNLLRAWAVRFREQSMKRSSALEKRLQDAETQLKIDQAVTNERAKHESSFGGFGGTPSDRFALEKMEIERLQEKERLEMENTDSILSFIYRATIILNSTPSSQYENPDQNPVIAKAL